MSKPSYLFGTMHVKDKRVFNFSDSVMLSLQSCQRFALEVHPDTLMIKMFSTLQNQDSLRSLDKLLGKEDYEKLAKKFKEKNGYDMGKTDPMVLESLMEPNEDKADDKVSFIDAYLYGIARTLNKGILGLEDASSQFDEFYGSNEAIKERLLDLLDDDITAAKDDSKEKMIKIYSTGNLDEIYKYAEEWGLLDSTTLARNKVMATSMIKYMAGGTLFTAVGAAHLPGPDGVIALLRKEGYTVTRVSAGFTGVAARYGIDYMKMDWPVYRNENQGYSINFPGTPIQFNTGEVNTIIYPDLANEIYYGIYAVPRRTPDNASNRKQIIDPFLKNIKDAQKNHLISRRDVVTGKMPYTEIVVKSGNLYSRLRLFLSNNMLYACYADSKLNKLNLPHINRFLNSFTNIPIAKKAPSSWITYSNPVGAFTVKMPGQPKPITNEIPSKISGNDVKFVINMYVSTDSANSKTYLVRYNDYPAGTFLSHHSSLFDALEKDFNGKGKIVGTPAKIYIDGHEARELTLILNDGFYAKARIFARGNRVYMLFKEITQPGLKDDSEDVFFDSFKLTPYAQPEFYTFRADSGNYELQMVAKPRIVQDTGKIKNYGHYLKNTTTYYSTNPNSGGFFGFEHSTVSPYMRVNNIDSLYQKLTDLAVTYQDSLVKVDTIMLDGVKGRDVLTQQKGTDFKRRTRILIKGDDVFYFIGRTDNSELLDKSSETFYNSLKIKTTTAKNNLAASKADLIFRDLGSADSITYKSARGALTYYDFTADELPLIYSALQKNYPDDTLETGVRIKLVKTLRNLHNDTTVSILVKLYQNLKNKDDLKGTILGTIPTIDNKNGYDIYLNLLTTNMPARGKNGYTVFKPLTDSVEFAAKHLEQLLPLMDNREYRSNILRITQAIANKQDAGYDKPLKDSYPKIMAYAQTDMENYIKRDSTDYTSSLYVFYYMQLMSKIKDVALNDKLSKYYLEKDPKGVYASSAVNVRVNNNLSIDPQLITKYLDTLGTRYDLMKAFNNQNQLSRVPLKCRQPVEFAKLCLYQSVSEDEYGAPEKITLLGSIIKNGSVYYVFKFLLPGYGDDDKKEMIGLTSPYTTGTTKLNFKNYNAYTEYEAVKTNWRAQAAKMIKPLMDAYK